MKKAIVGAVIGMISGCAGTPVIAAQHSSAKVTSEAEIIHLVRPAFPAKARLRCLTGLVTVEFTIGTDGRADNVTVTKSKPAGVFDQSVRGAVKLSSFKPRIVNGTAVPSRFRYTYHFDPSDSNGRDPHDAIPLAPAKPKYPKWTSRRFTDALGLVAFRFTVRKDGHADNIVLMKDKSFFNVPKGPVTKAYINNARKALEKSVFAPQCLNAEPVPSQAGFAYMFMRGTVQLLEPSKVSFKHLSYSDLDD